MVGRSAIGVGDALSVTTIGADAIPVGASESQLSSFSSGVVGGVEAGLSFGSASQSASSSIVAGGLETGIERDEAAPGDQDAGAEAVGGADIDGNGLDAAEAEGTTLAGPGALLERPGRIDGAGTPINVPPLPFVREVGATDAFRSTLNASSSTPESSFGAIPTSVCWGKWAGAIGGTLVPVGSIGGECGDDAAACCEGGDSPGGVDASFGDRLSLMVRVGILPVGTAGLSSTTCCNSGESPKTANILPDTRTGSAGLSKVSRFAREGQPVVTASSNPPSRRRVR